jgi:hypothetical protein
MLQGRLAWPVKRQMDILVSTPGILRKFLAAGLCAVFLLLFVSLFF